MIKKSILMMFLTLMTGLGYAQNVNVTFTVESPDSLPVYVFGDWSGWGNWPGNQLASLGNNLYSVTLPLAAGSTHEFLYVNGTTPAKEVLNPAWSCTNGNGQYTNRKITLGSTNLTICNKWAKCDTCGSTAPSNINVTFQVQNPPSTNMYVFGSWGGWTNWPGTPLVSLGGGKYGATIAMTSSTNIEYLFVADTVKEALDTSWACTNHNPQYTNRLSSIGIVDTTLCFQWKTCLSCTTQSVSSISLNYTTFNYSTDFVRINSSTNQTLDQLSIYDITGRVIYSSKNKVSTNSNIPVKLDRNVMYLFVVKNENEVKTFKGLLQ